MANAGSFVKGQKKPNQGKRGPDKTTRTAKEAIALAAEGLGGTARLIEWCKEDPLNERAFWVHVYPKLIPVQVTGEGGGPIQSVSMTLEEFQRVAAEVAAKT